MKKVKEIAASMEKSSKDSPLSYKAKVDNAVMRLLKLSSIRHVIAHTSRGDLCLNLPFEGTWQDYRFFLDAVPLDDEDNEKLMGIVKDSIFVYEL